MVLLCEPRTQKAEDIHIDIDKDVETRFDTSKYELRIKKSYWINEGRIEWKTNDIVCCIKT